MFITHTEKDVNEFAVIFARVVQLTHGVPIKRMGWDRDHSLKRRVLKTIRGLVWGEYFRVFVSARKTEMLFASAFRCDESRIASTGYPRNDVLREPDKFSHPLVADDFQTPFGDEDRIIGYLPTFRMFETPPFYEEIDFGRINDALADTDYKFLVKPHPGTSPPSIDDYDNVYQTNESIDIYPHLARFDALVSDYSSVALDYAVLHRPLIHFVYDRDAYERNRGFYFDLDEILPGIQVEGGDEFVEVIKEVATRADSQREQRSRSEFVRHEGLASEEIVAELISAEG